MQKTRRGQPAMGVRGVILAGMLDMVFVLVFVLIGRASHQESLLGVLETSWPFLGGLAIGWLLMRAWRTPMRIRWTGLGIWAGTVIGGLLLRVVAGQGVQPSFMIVTALVLGAFLLGWRGLAALISHSRARETAVDGFKPPA